jgi:hypothetical protein
MRVCTRRRSVGGTWIRATRCGRDRLPVLIEIGPRLRRNFMMTIRRTAPATWSPPLNDLPGEAARTQQHRGEFGHVAARLDGEMSCGSTGCWERISNRATLARYFGRSAESPVPPEQKTFTIEDLITRARAGDTKAVGALQTTARYLGIGLGSVVNVLDPARIFIGGEITAAWDIVAETVRAGLAERALTPAAAATAPPVAASEYPRLQGAAASSSRLRLRRRWWRDGAPAIFPLAGCVLAILVMAPLHSQSTRISDDVVPPIAVADLDTEIRVFLEHELAAHLGDIRVIDPPPPRAPRADYRRVHVGHLHAIGRRVRAVVGRDTTGRTRSAADDRRDRSRRGASRRHQVLTVVRGALDASLRRRSPRATNCGRRSPRPNARRGRSC